HVRCLGCNPHDTRPRRGQNAGEASAELRVTVADEYRRHSLQGGVPGWRRTPLVARRVRHCGVDDRASPKVEEEEHEDLAEPDVVGLHEVARPRDVIPQEGRPALPVAAGPRATHVSLDGSLADADAELEQLAAEALRAPARIAGGHPICSQEGSFRIVRHQRQKYTCRCGACVETALGPPKLVAGGRYSVDFAVAVAIAKYGDHLPLARQVRQMARLGLTT